MKKHLLLGTALVLLGSAAAWAADNATPAAPAIATLPPGAGTPVMLSPAASAPPAATEEPASAAGEKAPAPGEPEAKGHKHHQWSLEEARKHAHAHADKLDKMTDAEWKAKQDKRKEWKEKWDKMTPEEKDAYKKSHHHHGSWSQYHKKPSGASASPPSDAPAGSGQ